MKYLVGIPGGVGFICICTTIDEVLAEIFQEKHDHEGNAGR